VAASACAPALRGVLFVLAKLVIAIGLKTFAQRRPGPSGGINRGVERAARRRVDAHIAL
jgi:hypothetical protein